MSELKHVVKVEGNRDEALVRLGALCERGDYDQSETLVTQYEPYYEPDFAEFAGLVYVQRYGCRVYYTEV